MLMTWGGQLPGHQISSRKAGPYGEPPEPRAAERSSHCPGSVPSQMLRAADPPTCSGPQALASDLRGLAWALATTQGCVGDRASQQATSASRALLSLPSASRSVGLAAWGGNWGTCGPSVTTLLPGKTSAGIRQVPGVQPWALSWQADPSPSQVGGAPLGPTPSSQPLQEVLAHPALARATLGLPVTPTPPPSLFWVFLSHFQARLTAKPSRFQGPGVCEQRGSCVRDSRWTRVPVLLHEAGDRRHTTPRPEALRGGGRPARPRPRGWRPGQSPRRPSPPGPQTQS